MHAHAQHHNDALHSHAPADFGRAFAIGIVLNAAFVALEAAAGWLTGSLALLADAGHNLSDVAGLLLAWGAAAMAKTSPTASRTYGLRRSTILASLANALLLMAAVGAILWEAVHRLTAPQPIDGLAVAAIAAAGILVNAFTAFLFFAGRKGDLNVRGAYLHMAADAAVSLGVVLAAVAMMATGWLWLDPAISAAIALVIAWGTWGLLAESVRLALDGVPRGLDQREVAAFLGARPGVEDVHDLHVWALSTTETALTAHLVRPGGTADDAFLSDTAAALKAAFGIAHATLQLEQGPGCADCSLLHRGPGAHRHEPHDHGSHGHAHHAH